MPEKKYRLTITINKRDMDWIIYGEDVKDALTRWIKRKLLYDVVNVEEITDEHEDPFMDYWNNVERGLTMPVKKYRLTRKFDKIEKEDIIYGKDVKDALTQWMERHLRYDAVKVEELDVKPSVSDAINEQEDPFNV